MNKIVEGFLVFVAVALIFLGVIFLIAGALDTIAMGAIMIIIAAIILVVVYRIEKIEATKPTLVSQTFNVKMEGSGKFSDKEMRCKSCGAPLTDKELKIVQGSVMVTCPYCGATYAMQEAPKW
jgi:predicted RNA-binding Zn-ribbon protein involved in translation (DUF1610 family)